MVYATLELYNLSQGPHVLMCFANDVVGGLFMWMLYLVFWLIIVAGSYMASKKQTGIGDLPMSMSFGSFATFILSVMFRLIDCTVSGVYLTDGISLGVIIVTTFISVLWLLMSRD